MAYAVHSTFSDPIPFQEAIRAADVNVMISEGGNFQASLSRYDFDRLWMQRGKENLARVSYAANSGMRAPIFFLTSLDQPPICHSGMNVVPGELVFYSSAATHHHWTQSSCQWGSMSLTPGELAETTLALAGRAIAVPANNRVVRPRRESMSRLLALHETAEQLAVHAPAMLEHAEVSHALEQALLHAMVACLTEVAHTEMRPGARHHMSIISRFEEFLIANPDRPLYLADICAATGASERTLRASCQEHLGMGPIKYLLLRRIHLARRALLFSTPNTATVTEIAMALGFWELGRFSVEYRRLFGESPSVSLRRPPDDSYTKKSDAAFQIPILHSVH